MSSKLDTIIAVREISVSSKWYQSVFGWRSAHGGDHFDILVDEQNEVMLCLHPWHRDEHPTMMNPDVTPGNGLILYFRTLDMHTIRENIRNIKHQVAEEIHRNPNSLQMEFSVRDPDGYYLTVSEFHEYDRQV